MADSNIGSLPQAQTLDDDSLLVAEQQGQAVKVTGAQFKEFGRQAVIGQVQGYVDQAEAAADRAVDAVSAVTDMTVEAFTLASGQDATVSKTIKNGKVNLAFGLPRGEQGIQGPEGQTGPRGPQGAPGNGLTILGHYDTEAELRAAVTAPDIGDAYSVGTETPYDTYILDGVTLDWKNYGPLSGGGGGILPDNVVTADGGASMTFPIDLGDGPHVITFTEEEDDPLSADDIAYDNTQTGMEAESVQEAVDELFTSVSDGKSLIASAITDKGVTTAQDATFEQMAENIEQISGGGDTSDATATSFDILAPKTAYTAVGKVEGVIPTLLGQTITPGTANKVIAGGQYLGGDQIIKGDPNLTSANIKSGVTLFGVEGSLESTFEATLTVTADSGAMVTVTHTDGTSLSALSQTGTVVFELPKEGTWKVTAVRGVAQYNTVVIEVTSQYSASLTAEVHIEYYLLGIPLSTIKANLAATTIGNYALFGGGNLTSSNYSAVVDAYSSDLTRTKQTDLSAARSGLAATTIGNYALFGGGYATSYSAVVDAYNSELTHTVSTPLSAARANLAATSIGSYALFGGGSASSSTYSAIVYAYNSDLTRTTITSLIQERSYLSAAFNNNYALFGGGNLTSSNYSAVVDAYNSDLTRTSATSLTVARRDLAATTAGNYVLFGGGTEGSSTSYSYSFVVDAYDLFLTRTSPEPLKYAKSSLAATTLKDHGIFAGGLPYQNNGTDVYDPFLVRSSPDSLSAERYSLAAASIGNYALFGGGQSGGTATSDKVDVYRYV